MLKKYIIISDIEMGRGDITDDFSDDDDLADFFSKLQCENEDQFTLVLNGDIFDFLKMDFKGERPRYITEKISLWKLNECLKAHPNFFEALKKFLKNPKHHLQYVIGNHDFDMIWPGLQQRFKDVLGCQDRISFGFFYDDETMHVEHGHLLDTFYEHNPSKPFVMYKGQKILYLPLGSQIFFEYLIPMKKKYPKEEQYDPRIEVKHVFPDYHKAITKIQLHNIHRVFFNRFLNFFDPTYHVNLKGFFRHIWQFGFDFVDDRRTLIGRMGKLGRKHPSKELFLLGHGHLFRRFFENNQHFLVTDTWRNEYHILKEGHPKKDKTYAEVLYKDGVLCEAELRIFEPTKS